ncbi:NAD-dependent epimerase/dehydratase family protein [Dyella soli]|uniref:NAD-dependent epimerase/dehydratase family protein n=1 Tax=Dyella soli TaxID=522319 RepID=A0A4R0YQ95_9GAMM|nr:NAD-dependent epimerase/dehydratase family protein [Dyella soli]TCI11127.1 NAD-dependent epimerase/dehydratase family protein [Dyella soli]
MANPSDNGVKPTALITGSRGFTGKYLVAELESAGYVVFGASHEEGGVGAERSVDLCNRGAVHDLVMRVQPDVVVHLAAIAFVAHGDVDAIYRTNVLGTRNLLEALASSPKRPRAVLLASSANIYGNTDIEPITEDVAPAPANDYAVSKLAMEYMARLWMDRLPIVLARPFNYTGVGQSDKFLLSKIVEHFRRGEKSIELGNIDVFRDFQDVRFVVSAYRRLLESNAIGQTVNLCSGVGTSLTEAIQIMEELAGYRIDVRVNPQFVRENEVKRLVGSNDKLRQLIGDIVVIPLKQTLAWMYQSPT